MITFAGDVGAGTFFPQVGPEQLRGIEINDYAYELAQVTVWIGYIQWLRDNLPIHFVAQQAERHALRAMVLEAGALEPLGRAGDVST